VRFQNGHLHRLMRPEFVGKYSKPLCSDAYSGFIMHDPKMVCICYLERKIGRGMICVFVIMSEHNSEVIGAPEHLMKVVIPEFGKLLTSTSWKYRTSTVDIAFLMHR
jgi:hypothetical protein